MGKCIKIGKLKGTKQEASKEQIKELKLLEGVQAVKNTKQGLIRK